MRPTRQQMFIEIAQVVAKRSTCFRLNVGAVVVIKDRIVSIGYNGAPAGHDHCAGNACPGVTPGNCPTIHAEVNALSYMSEVFKTSPGRPETRVPKDVYITHMPCLPCARVMIGHDVTRVFYATPYRYTDAIDLLLDHHVEVYQVTPAGYVVRYADKEVVTL